MNDRYLNVLKRLYMTNKFKKKKVDLEMIKKGCDLFNNPQKNIDYIHVTGTNGKGSVCKKLSSVFSHSGLKTGLFISPHIASFRERIQIDNQMIEKEYIVEELERMYDLLEKNNLDLTYFELVTLLMFNYYKDKKIDVGVIEVGLGGNLDATNVVDPLLSIITSIGMDHMDTLGFTQREIAENKSGIIKYNRPSLIGSDCNPVDVFIKRSHEVNSQLYRVEKDQDEYINSDFDRENNKIVIKAFDILKKYYPTKFGKISQDDINYGIQQKQPCRKENVFQTLGIENIQKNFPQVNLKESKIKAILLDVAHNSHAMEKLLPSLRQEYPKANLNLICGFSQGKDKHELFKIISSYADKIYLTSTDNPRLTKYSELRDELKSWLLNFLYDKSLYVDLQQEEELRSSKYTGLINETIHRALKDCQNSDKENVLVICGTFFIMKDARRILGFKEEDDPVELNEINPVKYKV
jgi:dihydrofolate synthase / folylpolyglutamate synthase